MAQAQQCLRDLHEVLALRGDQFDVRPLVTKCEMRDTQYRERCATVRSLLSRWGRRNEAVKTKRNKKKRERNKNAAKTKKTGKRNKNGTKTKQSPGRRTP